MSTQENAIKNDPTHEEAVEKEWATHYALGKLSAEDRNRFEEHFFDCPECLEGVRTAYLLVRGAETVYNRPLFGMETAPVPAVQSTPALVRAPRHRSWILTALPYAALVVLSIGAGRQYVELHDALAPGTVVSFPVLAQAKGAPTQITISPGVRSVVLELDVFGSAAQYQFEIRSVEAGRLIGSGTAPRPKDKSKIEIDVPAGLLHPGSYEATLSAPAEKTSYPFDVIKAEGTGAP